VFLMLKSGGAQMFFVWDSWGKAGATPERRLSRAGALSPAPMNRCHVWQRLALWPGQ